MKCLLCVEHSPECSFNEITFATGKKNKNILNDCIIAEGEMSLIDNAFTPKSFKKINNATNINNIISSALIIRDVRNEFRTFLKIDNQKLLNDDYVFYILHCKNIKLLKSKKSVSQYNLNEAPINMHQTSANSCIITISTNMAKYIVNKLYGLDENASLDIDIYRDNILNCLKSKKFKIMEDN